MKLDYLKFDTEQDAKDFSAQLWLQVLGHPKKPEDITEFLISTITNPLNGTAIDIVPDDAKPILSDIQLSTLVDEKDPEVKSTLDAVSAAIPG